MASLTHVARPWGKAPRNASYARFWAQILIWATRRCR